MGPAGSSCRQLRIKVMDDSISIQRDICPAKAITRMPGAYRELEQTVQPIWEFKTNIPFQTTCPCSYSHQAHPLGIFGGYGTGAFKTSQHRRCFEHQVDGGDHIFFPRLSNGRAGIGSARHQDPMPPLPARISPRPNRLPADQTGHVQDFSASSGRNNSGWAEIRYPRTTLRDLRYGWPFAPVQPQWPESPPPGGGHESRPVLPCSGSRPVAWPMEVSPGAQRFHIVHTSWTGSASHGPFDAAVLVAEGNFQVMNRLAMAEKSEDDRVR